MEINPPIIAQPGQSLHASALSKTSRRSLLVFGLVPKLAGDPLPVKCDYVQHPAERNLLWRETYAVVTGLESQNAFHGNGIAGGDVFLELPGAGQGNVCEQADLGFIDRNAFVNRRQVKHLRLRENRGMHPEGRGRFDLKLEGTVILDLGGIDVHLRRQVDLHRQGQPVGGDDGVLLAEVLIFN